MVAKAALAVRQARNGSITPPEKGTEYDEHLARAALEAAMAELWRPIEEAPKDGRQMILLLTPSRFPQVAFSNTWWTAGFSVENKPTHWMPIEPLPTPPRGE